MSSSNSSRATASRANAAEVAERPDRQRIVGGDEAERAAGRARSSGGSAACRASGAPAGPRRDSRRDSGGCRAERSRPASRPRRGAASARCCSFSQSRTCVGQVGPALSVGEHAAHPVGQIGGERKLAAGIGRDLRVRRRRAWRPCASFSRMPSKRSIWPANRKVSPGVSASMKYSSISPSTRPPARRQRLPRCRARRDIQHLGLDDGADIQPVLLGEARIGQRIGRRPVRGCLAIALIGCAARSRRSPRNPPPVSNPPGRARDRAQRCAPRRRALGDRTARRRHMPRMCWASTSSAPHRGALSERPRITASRAARHSSTSKRLAGTSSARDGSSSR